MNYDEKLYNVSKIALEKNNGNDSDKNLSEKVISFDNSDFNMESVNQAERRILEMVKCSRGELPLHGLIDRIDNCLEMIDKKQYIQIGEGSNCKVLKLESTNK